MPITEIMEYQAGSCALGGIKDLADKSHKCAKDAMITFCGLTLGFHNPLNKYQIRNAVGQFPKLTNFYVFTAGPEVPEDHPNGGAHSKPHWVKYGTEFTQFILDNGLGEVVTLGPKLNAKYHPTTYAQVWLWSPDQAKLEAWWLENRSDRGTIA